MKHPRTTLGIGTAALIAVVGGTVGGLIATDHPASTHRSHPVVRFVQHASTTAPTTTTPPPPPATMAPAVTTMPPGDVRVPNFVEEPIAQVPLMTLGYSEQEVDQCPPGDWPGSVIAQTPASGSVEAPPLSVSVTTCLYAVETPASATSAPATTPAPSSSALGTEPTGRPYGTPPPACPDATCAPVDQSSGGG